MKPKHILVLRRGGRPLQAVAGAYGITKTRSATAQKQLAKKIVQIKAKVDKIAAEGFMAEKGVNRIGIT